nr:hypothetical protein [Tanacetum cinerariifolium]
MSTLAQTIIAAGAQNRPSMLEKGEYDTWKSRMLLYVEGKEHGDMLLDSILKGPFPNKTLLNPKKIAYEIWHKVKELMEGTELTKQEKESKLADEFDKFTLEKGKTIHTYYIRFAKLMNDINIITLDMAPIQVNTNFDQLYAYLKQNEPDANEVRAMKARFPNLLTLIINTDNLPPSYSSYKSQYNPPIPVAAQQQPYITQPSYEPPAFYQQLPTLYQQLPARPTSPDSGFVVPTFLPMDDPIASFNKAMMFLTTAISSRYHPTNNQLRTSYNPRIQANFQDGRRVKDSELFKEKMLLAQQQEAWMEINDDQHDFLDDGLEAFNSDCLRKKYCLNLKNDMPPRDN